MQLLSDVRYLISAIDLSAKAKDDGSKQLGSPSRFGSCRDTSTVEEVFSSPARRSRLDLSTVSPSKSRPESPIRKFALNESEVSKTASNSNDNSDDDEAMEDDGSYRSAQRRRLKALASKFHHYEDEDSESMKVVLAQATATGSPYKRDLTKTVDVDKVINRSASPTTASKKKEDDLVKSLKAQGYEETSSKSKLYYDFKKGNSAAGGGSPYKPDPLQYIRPQQHTPTQSSIPSSSPKKAVKAPAYRSASPTRMNSPQPRPPSPYKPHPLQFVSPQKAKEAPPPPPKPARIYLDMEDDTSPKEVFKNEAIVHVAASQKNSEEERTDTASRRSILEKRSLFDKPQSPFNEAEDPAMLPLSQRKALFEKNKGTAPPKPIARFGESVTPAMLSRAQPSIPASEPAWKKQRRDVSPQRQFYTPKTGLTSHNATKKAEEALPSKKNLFDTNWKATDIAKAQEEAKRKDMEVLMNRFKKVDEQVKDETKEDDVYYPGVNSLKKVKVSPPRPGNLYPDLSDNLMPPPERPETAMSEESSAPSEAPSLGTAIMKMATKRQSPRMKAIVETTDDDEEMQCSEDDEINDMLDEALEDEHCSPSPPKMTKSHQSCSPLSSSSSGWEYQTPSHSSSRSRDFKTPRVDSISDSPQTDLPLVETEDGASSKLMHTVSFYRKQKPVVSNVTQLGKIVRKEAIAEATEEERCEDPAIDEDHIKAQLTQRINKLQEEVDEQMQRRAQASKALGICEAQNEFEGSYERVEFERLLLEAHHKHNAATTEINRLKNIMTRGQFDIFAKSKSKGAISISGIRLPLKSDFVKMLMNPGHGGDDYVHYFVCLVKYRSQVIATQMLSTLDGINRSGQLEFPNLINIQELDFDFQLYLEVYGLQTPKEVLTHEAKYHIRKADKSLFNLGTPLKKLKKMESKFVMTPNSNPVNSLSIRKSKFGMVGYTTITIDTLKNKSFKLEKVPSRSPLESSLLMKLSVHAQSSVTTKGFLTYFTEVNGYGDWHRRWCVLRGEI